MVEHHHVIILVIVYVNLVMQVQHASIVMLSHVQLMALHKMMGLVFVMVIYFLQIIPYQRCK
jgi:hypothetical protein